MTTSMACANVTRTCIGALTAAGIAAGLALLPAAPALAQANPTFTYGKPEDVAAPPAVQWKVQAKGGATASSGNSQSANAIFGLGASRKQGNNKVALDAGVAYGRSTVWSPVVNTNQMPNQVVGLDGQGVTTTNNWNAKGRYDRFLTLNNAAYLSAFSGADKIAGKSYYGGGQAGYSRQVFKNDMHLLVAELGYDLSYERYITQPNNTLDPVSVHSARLFVGESLKLSAATGITASAEALFNLNKEGSAYKYNTKETGVSAFHDTRIVGKLGLTTTLYKNLSFGFGFTIRYDQNPAPRPLPAITPSGVGYSPTFFPFAEQVDTLTEATLIYTFL